MANRLREARERLSSAGAGNVNFDIELLRLYAEGRLAAIVPQIMLCQAIAAMTTLWVPTLVVLVWLCFTLSALALACLLARRFLKLDRTERDARAWYARFTFAEAVNGVAWASFALVMTGVNDHWATTYVMVVFMLAAAIHTVVAAFVPAAVFAVLTPLAAGVVFYMAPTTLQGPVAPLTLLACVDAALFRHPRPAHLRQPCRLPGVAGGEGHADRRTGAGQGDFRRGAPPRRGGQSGEIPLPRHHVARIAHAAERHSRLFRGDEERAVRRPCRGRLPRLQQRHPFERRASADAHQRNPRPVARRGGALRAEGGIRLAAGRDRGLHAPAHVCAPASAR